MPLYDLCGGCKELDTIGVNYADTKKEVCCNCGVKIKNGTNGKNGK